VTFIKIRSHRRKFSNSDSIVQKNVLCVEIKVAHCLNCQENSSNEINGLKLLQKLQQICNNAIFITFYTDISNIRDHSVICINNFEENVYYNTKKSCRLIKGAVPFVFVSIKYCRMKRIRQVYFIEK
jgi:hypothetical protein